MPKPLAARTPSKVVVFTFGLGLFVVLAGCDLIIDISPGVKAAIPRPVGTLSATIGAVYSISAGVSSAIPRPVGTLAATSAKVFGGSSTTGPPPPPPPELPVLPVLPPLS